MATKDLTLPASEAEDARKLEALRAKIARSIDDPRESIPSATAFQSVKDLLANL